MVSRGLTPAQIAQFGDLFHPVVMAYLDWPSGAVRAHSGRGPIAWGGHTWDGVGSFGGVSVPAEAVGLGAFGAELALYGLPQELLALLDEPVRNRPARIWLGTVTEPGGNVLVAEPIEITDGYIDAARDRAVKNGKALDYAALVKLGVGPSARVGARITHSYEDQMDAYPGDTAGRHLVRIRDKAQRQVWPEN